MIIYRAMLDVPRALAQYLGRLLNAERRARGTRRRSRALTCFRQAVFGLRWFREDRDVSALARDCGISRATGYRYLDEIIEVLAAQAPDLHEALQRAKDDGLTHLVLDERAVALLVGRSRALRHITTSPRKVGTIVKAALVLTHFEHGRLT